MGSDEHSKRKRIAAIASRLSNVTSSSQQGAKQAVVKAVHPAAQQSAGILGAMAAAGSKVVKEPEHEEERYAYESPLHARRRLAAIATQLGLATSSAKQAPSIPSLSGSEADAKWANLPSYKSLPSEGGFPGCAWSVWGKGDQLGTINLLTDSVVARSAKEEIRSGARISLNWPLHLPAEPFFKRKNVTHEPWGKGGEYYTKPRDEVIQAMREKGVHVENRGDEGVPICDETLHMNTQSGSQWDGLRHYGHLGLGVFYGGKTRKEIQDSFKVDAPQGVTPQELETDESKQRNQLGVHHLAKHGICGRGVLLDVFGYLAAKEGKEFPYDPATGFRITIQHIMDTAKAQRVRFRQGDILLIRSGFTARYYAATEQERAEWSNKNTFAGVEQTEEIKSFLWDNHFAAVAGDALAFECFPSIPGVPKLHETLLGLWGMPIGEMFDLEALAAHCRASKHYTFYFASSPLNLYGGVASLANAMATM